MRTSNEFLEGMYTRCDPPVKLLALKFEGDILCYTRQEGWTNKEVLDALRNPRVSLRKQ